MRLMKCFLLLIAVTCSSFHFVNAQSDSSAQWLKGWNAAPIFCIGKIWKHTPKFEPTIDHASIAFELAISKQLNGKKSWQYAHHYPFLGFALAYNNLGNDSVLGKAYSILPFIEIPIAGGKNLISGNTGFSASFRVGSGLAWLTKCYDV